MSIKGLFPIDQWNFYADSIFAGLPSEDLELLMSHKLEQVYKKGDPVFRERAYPHGIFFIIKGRVKKFKVDRDGKEQIIYVANSGELMGYHAILSDDRYPDSATALEESRIAFIPREDFLACLNQSPTLTRRLLKKLSHEFAVLANGVTLHAQKPVRERLALQLIVLREKYKEDFQPGMVVTINMSRDDLANIIGTSKENVVRVLTDFKQEGILETNGRKISILDVTKLISIADYT